MTGRARTALVTGAASVALMASNAAALTPVPDPVSVYGTEASPTRIDAFRGHVVWSSVGPNLRGVGLKHRFKGRTEALPIHVRGVPFDADLGPDGRNHVALVYSRCAEDDPWADITGHRGCDLFRYDFKTRRETRLRKLNTASSERLPSLWGNRVAFVRSTRGRRTLVVGDARTGRVRTVPVRAPKGVQSVEDLELHDRHLAFIWTTRIPFKPRATAFAAIDLHTQVWLQDLAAGRARLLAREHYTTFPPRTYLSPSFGKGYVYFGVRTRRSRVFRWPLRGGAPERAGLPDPIISVQHDRGTFAFVLGADREPIHGWPCSVGETDVFDGTPSAPRVCTVGRLRQLRFR